MCALSYGYDISQILLRYTNSSRAYDGSYTINVRPCRTVPAAPERRDSVPYDAILERTQPNSPLQWG